jgi:hypothetical protein
LLRDYREIYRELQAMARAQSLSPEFIEAFAKKLEEYVQTLPENLRNCARINKETGKVYYRKDYPKLWREDPEFRRMFLETLLGGSK